MERLLFTWAFWHLHSCELVDLGQLDGEEEIEGDRDRQSVSEIGVSRTPFSDGAYGFEAELLACCRSDPDPIQTVIRRWAAGHLGVVAPGRGGLPLFSVVHAVQAARKELVERGVEVGEVQEFPWGSFVFFSDPDGNSWAVQQLPPRN